jgi:secreted trypsin-like serine protease
MLDNRCSARALQTGATRVLHGALARNRRLTRLDVLALAALAVACALAPGASASTGEISPRIVNGTDASITDFPFQVLLFDATTDPSDGRLCGGAVRDSTHIITAAHCVFDVFRSGQVSNASDLGILAGTADISSSGIAPSAVKVTASQIAFDPNYDPSTNTHDIAIITISGATPLWDATPPSNIRAIDIIDHTAWMAINPGDDLTVTGWGDMNAETGDPPGDPSFGDQLQKATVPLVSDTDCENFYEPSGVPIDPTLLFCAGNQDEGSGITDSCQGDSGGPIVSGSPGSFALVGLVDSGIGLCAGELPRHLHATRRAIAAGFLPLRPATRALAKDAHHHLRRQPGGPDAHL